VDIGVYLEGQSVPAVGSQTVSPPASKTYHLEAKGELVGRSLGQVTVMVDFGECETTTIPADWIAAAVKSQVETFLVGSSQITLRDEGTSVTLGDYSLTASVPLNVSVPDWFDATMDITLQFSLFATTHVMATIDNIDVDVSWSILDHLASLGCTGVVQAGMEIVSKSFIQTLIGAQLANQLAATFQSQLNNAVAALDASHPGHGFKFQSMGVNEQGVTFRICPVS
jgi:hypothetical protein